MPAIASFALLGTRDGGADMQADMQYVLVKREDFYVIEVAGQGIMKLKSRRKAEQLVAAISNNGPNLVEDGARPEREVRDA
jgi:hypothetical protein